MPQTLLELFLDSQETQYSTGNYPLMMLSAQTVRSGRINFAPVGAINDGTNDVVEYNIQRPKRIKEKNLDNTNASKPGSQYIDILNQSDSVIWETVKTSRSTQKVWSVKTKVGEETNALQDASMYERTANQSTNVKLISKEERGIAKLIADGTEIPLTKGTLGHDAFRQLIIDNFKWAHDRIAELVDDYKYNADSIALYNKRIGKVFADLQGKGYQQGTNTFGTDYTQGFRYAENDYYPEDVLKSIAIGTTADDTRKIVLGIVIGTEAYIDSGLEQGNIPYSRDLITHGVAGIIYDDLNVTLDKDRIFYLTATLADLKDAEIIPTNFIVQKKVND